MLRVLNTTTDNATTSNITELASTTFSPSTTANSVGRRRRDVTQDPFLNVTSELPVENKTLVWMLLFKKGSRPTLQKHDFNCTLPVLFYDYNDNVTVALGGAQRTIDCQAIWAENANASCERNTLNRNVYTSDHPITEVDDKTCFIPDTWIGAQERDVNIFIGVAYYYISPNVSINASDLMNASLDDLMVMPSSGINPMVQLNDGTEVRYEMSVFSASCKYWSPFYQKYTTEGCEVGPLTTPSSTQCICSHLQPPIPPDDGKDPEYPAKVERALSIAGIAFGSGLVIPFNTIDLNNSAFNHLDDNPLIFSVMVSIMCLYLCSCIWASAQDRKDAMKAGTSPLLDNDPRDRYLYELTVYTGGMGRAGTTSKVSMMLSGEEDETPARLIYDDKRPVLKRSGVDSFLMAVPRPLGALSHLRVWHDNSGYSPGWFFSRMQVVDMQTFEKFYFILDRWLSVSEDDGIIDRIVPLAGKDDMSGFNHVFYTKARKDLFDGHIWFSVFGKPHKSRFTRVQRLTCCLSMLFASMMANIFFYRTPSESSDGAPAQGFKIGPLSITLSQLLMGILSSLIAVPVNIVIALIFKNTKEPPFNWWNRIKCQLRSARLTAGANVMADELKQQALYLDTGDDKNRLMVQSRASFTNLPHANDIQPNTGKDKKKKFKLPWWFLFVGYFLALCVVGVSFWYTVEIGGVFGPEKSNQWMVSFVTSVIESIFCSQPIKVIGMALFWAIVIRKPATDDDADPGLEKGQEYLHKHEKQCSKLSADTKKRLHKFKNIPLPPTEEYLHAARVMRVKETKMMDILRELLIYILFLYLLLTVSYGNRDPAANTVYNNLRTEFSQGMYAPTRGQVSFSDVVDFKSFWLYLNETLVPTIWPDFGYDAAVHESGYTADGNSYLVGVPRLRQLRQGEEACGEPMSKMVSTCNPAYSLLSEDTGSYYPGWIPIANTSVSGYTGPYSGWHWQSMEELDGVPFSGQMATYGGGGFNVELGRNKTLVQNKINQLVEDRWIDQNTRAVVIEFVLYNANMNLFMVSSMTFEFLPTGATLPVFKMSLIRLDRYIGTYMIVVMAAELLTIVYIIYFTIKESRAIYYLRRDYFRSFWNITEFLTLLLCLSALGMAFYRIHLVNTLSAQFMANRDKFVSFDFTTTWEETYGYILAFIIFFATVKFLKLLRFNKRMTVLGLTLMYTGKSLLSFLLALAVFLVAFTQMAYLVYNVKLKGFSSFIASFETLFTVMLNKFDYKSLQDANPVFAPIIFFSFVVIVTFVMVNFMVTIILEGFIKVQYELSLQENEHEIISFIISKLAGVLGLGSGPRLPPMNRAISEMNSAFDGEFMDKLEEMEIKLKDFCRDESEGQEELIRQYEKELISSKEKFRSRLIYACN